MKTKALFLAIEAGGSRARAAVSFRGRIVAHSISAGLNPSDIGLRHFERRLRSLVSPLVKTQSPRPRSIHACAAIAGAGRALVLLECEKVIRGILVPFARRIRLRIMTDAEALSEVCLRQEDGIVLIAGTGSICLGVKRQGRRKVAARVGGWGSCLDDGSGFRLGLAVLDAVLKTLEGRGDAATLVDLLCTGYGISPNEIPDRFIPVERERVAGLARIALDAYARNDPLSRTVVRRSARDLVSIALAVRERIALEEDVAIHICGGMFQSPVIRRLFTTDMRRRLPRARIIAVDEPLIHILSLARGAHG